MGRVNISGKQMKALCLLCCLVYFVSYLTRLNYAVCMVEIQSALQIGKNIAGLPVTASFLSYGMGQVICGFLGDKYNPRKMIFSGLAGSVLCNLLAVLLPRMEVFIPAWFVNGFFQSMLWPPLVRIMAENLDEDWYRKGCVWVSLSSSGATVVLYLLTPLLIRISGWKSVFYLAVAAGIGAFAVVVGKRPAPHSWVSKAPAFQIGHGLAVTAGAEEKNAGTGKKQPDPKGRGRHCSQGCLLYRCFWPLYCTVH